MQKTTGGAEPDFGSHSPKGLAARLIAASQGMPTNGLGKKLALLLRRLARRLHGPVFDVTIHGIRLRLHPGENVGERKFLFMPQFFDPEELRLIREALPADGTFVDIGANVGLYTLHAAKRLDSRGRILAIEPGSRVRERLLRNIRLNAPAARVEVVDRAVGESAGDATLYSNPGNLGGASIVRDFGMGGETVGTLPLLALLEEHGITGIDIMKIDIEGAEDVVLTPFFRDAPSSLHPSILILERSEGSWASDLLGQLRALGYAPIASSKMNHILGRTERGVPE